jgi:hypothetical protein
VCNQDNARAIEFTFDFNRPYLTAADDAGSARPAMSLVHAIDNGQASLR